MTLEMPFRDALGWALLHSSWQGMLAASLVVPFRAPRARYAAGCLALSAVLVSFLFTFWRGLPDESGHAAAHRVVNAGPWPASAGAGPDNPAWYGSLLVWLGPLWLAGVVVCQVRTVASWMATRRLRRRGVCPSPAFWRKRLGELAARLGVSKPVQLLESALIGIPIAAGYLRPVILMPAGLLAAMPPEQVEAILLHELAHLRRHDYLVNLLQAVVEGLFFYHPAVWWISGTIRTEREHCCDDLAASAIGERGVYQCALALTALEARRSSEGFESAAGVAATGGNLMKRIERLLQPGHPGRSLAGGWIAAPALALAIAGISATAWQARAVPPQAQQEETPYQRWVNEDVAFIIEPAEREAFLRLQTNEEREYFIGQFWQRRDPSPGTVENEFKEEHYRRIAYANERYWTKTKSGWRTDRGRIYILYGPPDEIESHPSGRAGGPPSDRWLYNSIEGIGKRVIVEFQDVNRDGDYRQTGDPAANKR